MTGITLIGGGGHGLVAFDCAAGAGLKVTGFYDDASDAPLSARCPWLGPLQSALTQTRALSLPWLLTLGDLATRRRVLGSIGTESAPAVIHPSAVVAPSARVGRGVLIGPGAIVNALAVVGDHAIVNSGAIVEHECRIGENAHIAPGAVVAGRAAVGDDTLIGLGGRILPALTIGSRCTIGAGAVVTRSIGDDKTAAGVPAKPLR